MSTVDQNFDIQLAQAKQAGFTIDEVVADHGISGISTRLADRPEGKRLFDKLRAGDVLVVRWVDRLGRNYADVTEVIRTFMNMGVVVKTVINRMVFDGSTSDPIQQAIRDAMIGFMAATAQAQAEALKEAQRAGIAAVKGNPRKYRGKKPSYYRKTFEQVVEMLNAGNGASAIARETGISRQAVLRIRDNPAAAEAALERWEM